MRLRSEDAWRFLRRLEKFCYAMCGIGSLRMRFSSLSPDTYHGFATATTEMVDGWSGCVDVENDGVSRQGMPGDERMHGKKGV